jgi:hypothetical protein
VANLEALCALERKKKKKKGRTVKYKTRTKEQAKKVISASLKLGYQPPGWSMKKPLHSNCQNPHMRFFETGPEGPELEGQ